MPLIYCSRAFGFQCLTICIKILFSKIFGSRNIEALYPSILFVTKYGGEKEARIRKVIGNWTDRRFGEGGGGARSSAHTTRYRRTTEGKGWCTISESYGI